MFPKYGKFQDLQVKDNICEKKTFMAIDYFSFCAFNCELRYANFHAIPTWILTHKHTTVTDECI